MSLNEIIAGLLGYCVFDINGEHPERFISLAAKSDLGLWDITHTQNGLRAKISAFRYRRLLPPARKTSVRLKTVSKHGLPFLITPYMHRPGVPLGVLIFIVTIWFLSQFVWFIELPKNLSAETAQLIEEQLYEAGLRPGALRSHLSGSVIADELTMRIPDISWAGVNIIGSNVTVDAKELKGELVPTDRSTPRNLIASCSGTVESVLCTSGQAVVAKGDSIAKGELLISGVVEYDDASVHFVYAEGEVTARTDFFLSSRVEYEQNQYARTGKMFTLRRVMLFGLELPLWLGDIPDGRFDREYETIIPEISGVRLPFELRTERWYELEPIVFEISREAAAQKARADVASQLNDMELIELLEVREELSYSEFAVTCTIYVTATRSIAIGSEILFDNEY